MRLAFLLGWAGMLAAQVVSIGVKWGGEAERDSGVSLKLFGFIAESVFAFIPESCSGSSRTAVGIIAEWRSSCPGFPR